MKRILSVSCQSTGKRLSAPCQPPPSSCFVPVLCCMFVAVSPIYRYARRRCIWFNILIFFSIMGTIRSGANGGFSGKAGSVIGSSWKSIDYIKGLPKKRTKPMSEDQRIQQARFGVLASFLMPLRLMVPIGYRQIQPDRAAPMNVAVKQTMDRAITGNYPDFSLDYAAIRSSEGRLLGGGTVSVEVEAG